MRDGRVAGIDGEHDDPGERDFYVAILAVFSMRSHESWRK